jgi:hypothetical protein
VHDKAGAALAQAPHFHQGSSLVTGSMVFRGWVVEQGRWVAEAGQRVAEPHRCLGLAEACLAAALARDLAGGL